MTVQSSYQITRIRLINFHNFVDETIDLAHGGHLFLLGDNGCGKTTILDAIHYVLTVGHSLEWNAAARVAGSKREGRRIQGIVMRYNLDCGAINHAGGVTYALLEIKGRHGLPLTVGMGLSTSAMDERIKQWGVIRECPITDIPLVIEDAGGRRPADRQELKELLKQKGGFYNDPKSYQHELARRLFGGEENYQDICRFLAMGKAYREIASQAADYHQLFKSLLPEPKTEIFERIIEALRTLDQSKSMLDDLERKLSYLKDLQGFVVSISADREAAIRYEWLSWQMREIMAEKAIAGLRQQMDRRGQDMNQLTASRQREEETESSLRMQLDDLKTKDSAGLVRQEKEGREELLRKERTCSEKKRECQEVGKAHQVCLRRQAEQQKSLVRHLAGLHGDLSQGASLLPFSLSSLLTMLDTIGRSPDPVSLAIDVTWQDFVNEADTARDSELRQQTIHEQARDAMVSAIASLSAECQRLRAMDEAQPILPGWADCLAAMRAGMLSPRPLYSGLEWKPGLKRQEQEAIEESIGQETAAILVLSDAEFAAGREIAANWPGIRITCPGRGLDDLPEWMRTVFDMSQSDPACLRCLAAEMVSDLGPLVTLVTHRKVLSFRSHDRALVGEQIRLIGEGSRREAIRSALKRKEEELRLKSREQADLDKQLKGIRQTVERLEKCKTTIVVGINAIHLEARQTLDCGQELIRLEDLLALHNRQYDDLSREVSHLSERLKGLARLIQLEGLAALEGKISKLTTKLNSQREVIRQIDTQLGEAKARQVVDQEAIDRKRAEHGDAGAQRSACAERLRVLLPDLEDIDHYVLRTWKGMQFKTQEAVQKEREGRNRAILENRIRLKERLNDPEFGAAFRFHYDEQDNEVFDFRGRRLPEIVTQLGRDINEQHEVINERTKDLFKKIIMTELVNYLRAHVGQLDQMIRTIRTLLGKRSFGNQQYRFRIKPVEKYRRLVTVINKFSPFDPAAEEELRHFFEDHRQEIINTEVGAIPAELDYRNWYSYEMEVAASADHGVVMDRRTKSMGSGGEQAVPNYLLVLTIAHFLYCGKKVKLHILLFDEAFYGIDAGRRDQLLGFATDLGLQLFVASPDQDGVRREISYSTTILVKKDTNFDVHLYPYHWQNPDNERQIDLFSVPVEPAPVVFGEEL